MTIIDTILKSGNFIRKSEINKELANLPNTLSSSYVTGIRMNVVILTLKEFNHFKEYINNIEFISIE